MPLNTLSQRVFYAGTLIFEEGESGDRAYLVERGAVEIVKRTKSGERRLGVIPPGGLFGEMALLDGAPRMASARAKEETVCRVIPRELVAAKLRSADPFLAALLRIMLANARSAAEAAVTEAAAGP